MEAVAHKTTSRTTTVQPAAVPRHIQRKAVETRTPVSIQTSLKVSSPKDPAEREADASAKRIMRLALPERPVGYGRNGGIISRRFESPYIARFGNCGIVSRDSGRLDRKAEGEAPFAPNVTTQIQSNSTAGAPLPMSVRRFMEPRFRADFSKVRIHSGDHAARLSRRVNAQAFTVGSNIFFGREKFQPETHEGKELIAHELTHTIQQGAAVQRSVDPSVREQSLTMVQRDLSLRDLSLPSLPDPREWFAEKAAAIPGFTMLTVIIGFNPITNARVDRSAGNILRAAIEMIPGGVLITQALNNHGIFDKVSTWASQQFNALKDIGSSVVSAVNKFIASVGLNPLNLGALWSQAVSIVTDPINRIKAFAISLKDGIIQLIKEAILKPLAALAKNTRGYDLLCAIMGRDPITGDPVSQDAETLIGGFLKFIGEDETWERIKQAKAIPRISAWFKGALGELKGFVSEIPGLFAKALKALEIIDIILVPRAFAKLVGVFGNFAGRFISWGAKTIWNLLEIIFDVVSPGALLYIKKTGKALNSILRNPLPFVGNLVKAAKLGFTNFASNFLTHLKNGLIEWLTGALAGVYIPKALYFAEIGKLAHSVLGITWAQIRAKIVKALGPSGDKIMSALETAFDIVVALVKGGPAAAWEIIKEKLTALKDTVIGGIISMVIETVISKAVPKLISMFVPGAGFISAIISIYDTIMVFVNKISRIIQVVKGFIDSIVGIAAGAIGAAAARVESTLAGALSLTINFLTGFVGLGKIADKVMGVIKKVQASVDKALDKAIDFIIAKAKALFGILFGKKDRKEQTGDVISQATSAALLKLSSEHKQVAVDAILKTILSQLKPQGLKRLELGAETDKGEYPVIAEASPPKQLLKLAPKRRRCRMIVTLSLKGDSQPLLEGVTTKLGKETRFEGGTKTETSLPAPLAPVEGKSAMGGLLVPPESQSREVNVVTWNTGELDPRVLSNATHAERQFSSWFETQPTKWRERVESIDTYVDLSPCTKCAVDLGGLTSRLAPSLKSEEPAKLKWKTQWQGPLATTPQSIKYMQDRKWKVDGPLKEGQAESELAAEK